MKIELSNLTIGYNRPLIENLSMTLRTGETVGVIGSNGMGKSTLFKTILGMIRPIRGDVLYDGVAVSKLSNRARAEYISYAPQARASNIDFSVEDIVLMGRASFINKFSVPSENDRHIVRDTLKQLHIDKISSTKYSELSGGQQQLTIIARAMVQESKFIVMDEPSSNLDYANQKILLNTINQLNSNGIGVLLATHTPSQLFACCKYVLMFFNGGRYSFGAIDKMLTNENLTAVYGVDMAVLEGVCNGHHIKSCTMLNDA